MNIYLFIYLFSEKPKYISRQNGKRKEQKINSDHVSNLHSNDQSRNKYIYIYESTICLTVIVQLDINILIIAC